MTTLRLIGYWRPEIARYDNALRSGDLTPRQIQYLRTGRAEAEASPWPDPGPSLTRHGLRASAEWWVSIWSVAPA